MLKLTHPVNHGVRVLNTESSEIVRVIDCIVRYIPEDLNAATNIEIYQWLAIPKNLLDANFENKKVEVNHKQWFTLKGDLEGTIMRFPRMKDKMVLASYSTPINWRFIRGNYDNDLFVPDSDTLLENYTKTLKQFYS